MIKKLISFFTGGSDESSAPAVASKKVEATAPVTSGDDLENFVDYVVRALVDAPEKVTITTKDLEDGKLIQIGCNKDDIGKVVGKRGKTIMAIRSLVSGAAGRLKRKVTVEVSD